MKGEYGKESKPGAWRPTQPRQAWGSPNLGLHVHTYPLHPNLYMVMWFDLSESNGLHKAKRFTDAILEKQSQQKALKPPLQRSGAER